MNAPVSPIVLLNAVRFERDKRAAEKSLMEFVRQSWHIVEPGTPFIDGWHLHAIAMHRMFCFQLLPQRHTHKEAR